MRKITALILILLSAAAFGQTEAEIIKKADGFITDKKYETAFSVLDNFDPTNDKPDIVLKKEDIVLNYFVTSVMHQLFALTDIDKNEDIMDYRGSNGSFNIQMFDADSLLTRLTKIYPDNCKLYKGLGDYYFDVHQRYGDNWLRNSNDQIDLMQTNFKKAVEGNCADFMSYYVLGYTNLVQENYSGSIPYFLKSIELDKTYPSSNYNLAYAYLFTDDRENALKYAKAALELYEYKEYKADAARMIGQIYTELKDDKNALTYYETADNIVPGDYYSIKPLLNIYVKTGNPKAKETTKIFFDLEPDNPTIYNGLAEIYYSNGKEQELVDFYNSQLDLYKDNYSVRGNLNFYLASIYLDSDKKLAKEHFLNAKEDFEKVFEKDHQVFEIIKKGLERCE